MSEVQIDEAKVADEAVDAHYNQLSDDDKKTFDALDDDAKATKNKEIGETAVETAKEDALKKKGDTVPLATYLELKKTVKELADKEKARDKADKDKSDEDLKEKGEYKTLAETKTAELDTATTRVTELEASLKVYTDATEKKVETFISNVKEEDKQIVEAVLNGKTVAEKETLLPDLLKRFGSPEDINASAGGSADKKKQNGLELEEAKKKLELAKKSNDAMGVLNAQKTIRELEAQGKK